MFKFWKNKETEQLDFEIENKKLQLRELELHIGFLNLELETRKNRVNSLFK